MARLTLSRSHGASTLDDAKERIQQVIEEMKPTLEKHIDRVDWSDDGTEARLKGRHVKGTFSVDAKEIKVDLKLSMVASLVRGTIEARIDAALKEHLA